MAHIKEEVLVCAKTDLIFRLYFHAYCCDFSGAQISYRGIALGIHFALSAIFRRGFISDIR